MNIVWFNGPSAAEFYHIPPQSQEIGCNFIEQRRRVDHVCAYDGEVVNRLPQGHTRKSMGRPGWQAVMSDISYQCSGTMALVLAVELGWDHLYLVGCDWEITDISVFDQLYTWRPNTPRKLNRPRLSTLAMVAARLRLTAVGSPRDWPGVNFVSKKDFLAVTN